MNPSSRVGQPHPLRKNLAVRPEVLEPVPEGSQLSTSTDRQLRYERRERSRSEPLNMATVVTQVERPLTSRQERDIRASVEPSEPPTTVGKSTDPNRNPPSGPSSGPGGSGDPDDPEGPDGPNDPEDPQDPDPGDDGEDNNDDDNAEVSNQELRKAIVALAKGKAPDTPRKRTPKAREPDPFDGTSATALRVFIFQLQIYFNTCKSQFSSDEERIYFAISYLRGAALDYFEPFINEPDPTKNYDFLTTWKAFSQKLTNLFGSYSPEDDAEDAITAIPFPDNGKATKYFIDFAKYQTQIKWDDRALRKVVKDAIPSRITEELRYSKEDISSFEGFKLAILRIDNDYWKRKQDEINKQKLMQTLQNRLSKNSQKSAPRSSPNPPREQSSSSNTPSNSYSFNNATRKFGSKPKPPQKPSGSSTSIPNPSASSSAPLADKLGPDGRLTSAERQRRMDKGLCLVCSQRGHIAKDCPKAKHNLPSGSTPNPKARASKTEPETEPRSKN